MEHKPEAVKYERLHMTAWVCWLLVASSKQHLTLQLDDRDCPYISGNAHPTRALQ